MIYDSLANFSRYAPLHPHFASIGDYLQAHDLRELPPGTYPVYAGSKIIVSEYETRGPHDCLIECHRRFIDIQVVMEGSEYIGVCRKESCTESDYDAERDFQQLSGEVDMVRLCTGLFMILYPEDGHMPGVWCDGAKSRVKKAVLKIPVSAKG